MDRGQPRHYSNLSRQKMKLLISPVRSHRPEAVVHPSPTVTHWPRLPPLPVPAQGTQPLNSATAVLLHCNWGVFNPGAQSEPAKSDLTADPLESELLWKKPEHCTSHCPQIFKLQNKVQKLQGFWIFFLNPIVQTWEVKRDTKSDSALCNYFPLSHNSRDQLATWMGLGAPWSSGKCPCPWQGTGKKWSSMSLPI